MKTLVITLPTAVERHAKIEKNFKLCNINYTIVNGVSEVDIVFNKSIPSYIYAGKTFNINHRNLIRQNPILTNLDSNEFNLQNIDHNQFSTINSSDHNLTLPETNTLRFSGVSPFNSTFMSMIRDMQQSNSINGFRN
jgi:hypothetical protein